MKRILIAAFLFWAAVGQAQAESFEEGINYQTVDAMPTADHPGKIEVAEFFWYGCPHCFQFEPALHEWLKTKPQDVVFVRMPAPFSPSWEPLSKAYFAAEMLGIAEESHEILFQAIHIDHFRPKTEQDLARFYVRFGVTEKQFLDAYNSFDVNMKIARAKQLIKDYKIDGVPAVVINGRYVTSGSLAGTYANVIAVTNQLIGELRKSR